MKRTLLAIGLLTGVCLPTIAQAQETDEVLVMRRAIAEPKGKTTIRPSKDFRRVPLTVRDTGRNIYAAKGSISLEIDAIGCLLTSGVISTDEALCVEGSGPSRGDIINFPSEMDPDLRSYYVPRDAYAEFLPQFSAQQIEALCTGSVTLAGVEYRGSCDPKAVVNTYALTPSNLGDPKDNTTRFPSDQNPSATASVLNLYVSATACIQNETRTIVGSASCAGLTKSPSLELRTIPANLQPEFRTVYVDQAEIRKAGPYMTDSVVNAVCTRTVRIAGNNWTVSCSAPRNPASFQRIPDRLIDPSNYYSSSTPQVRTINKISRADAVSFSVYGTRCYDVSSGAPAIMPSADCAYLSSGANNYDVVTLPATVVPELRTVYVTKTDLESAAGYQGKAGFTSNGVEGVSQICTTGHIGINFYMFDESNIQQIWKLVCGEPERPGDYSRGVSRVLDPDAFNPNNTVRYTNSDFNAASYSFTVKATSCRNTVTGSDGGTKCNFLTEGPNIYDLVSVPAAFVPEMREMYVKQEDLSAALGSQGAAAHYDSQVYYKTPSQICATTLPSLKVGPSTNRQDWTMRCGEPVTAADFSRSALILGDPYENYHYTNQTNRQTNSDPNATKYRFSVYSTECRNTKTGEILTASRCDYLPTGPKSYDIIDVPAVLVPQLREFYIDKDQLSAAHPRLTNIDDSNGVGSTIANACNGSETRFWIANADWTMKCGAPDDPARYADVPYSLVDPTAEYPNTAYRTLNSDLSSGVFKFGTYATRCIYRADGTSAPTTKCYYLTSNKAKQYDVVSVPVVYDQPTMQIRVTRAALESAFAYGARASYYSGNYKTVNEICTAGLNNLKAGGLTASWKMVCVN